jgi:hypothetical protein
MSQDRRVWIAQCLCPQRHCILAGADEAEDAVAAQAIVERLRETIATAQEAGVINPWCGLCNAATESWRYECSRTRFRSLAEAMPVLKESEGQQRLTAALWGDMPRSD